MSKPLFKDLFVFKSGRRNRKSYWLLGLLLTVVVWLVVASILLPAYAGRDEALAAIRAGDTLPQVSPVWVALGVVLGLVKLSLVAGAVVAIWAAAIQRFHDMNYSGWALLWLVVPFINFYFAYLLMFRRGTRGPNRFGADWLAADVTDHGSLPFAETPNEMAGSRLD